MLHLPQLSLTGGAKQGRMQVSAGFNDTLRKVSGLLGVQAHVVDEHGPNGRVVDLRILPSHVTRGSKTWQIYARKIQLDTAQVVIDRFFVMNREQELLLDGVAQPRGFGDPAPAQLRPRAFHAGRRALGVRRRGAHERFRDDEIRAPCGRNLRRHPARQSGGQRHSGSSAAALFALGFLAQPRRGDRHRPQ